MRRGELKLSKGEVLMNLHLARLNRTSAACLSGVSRGTFFRCMRVYRIQAPKPQWKLDPHDVPLIRELCRSGLTREEVAQKFDVHVNTIDRLMLGGTFRTLV